MRSDPTSKNSDTPIIVENLTKKFVLWHQKENSLKSTFINLVRSRELSRESFTPLDNISFTVKKGETLGVIGRNGSGKTTLLRVLAGITSPTSGTVEVDGRVSTLFELGTGFHAELSGRENIFLNGTILGLTRKEIEQKYDKIVEFAELGKFIDSPIKHYSSGMQMRLAFSVAISIDPDILLVDEVLAVGDASFQTKSYSAFQDFKRRGATTVFVTHDLGAVQNVCDRAMLLNKGSIVSIGRPQDVIADYYNLTAREEGSKQVRIEDANALAGKRFGDGNAQITKLWVADEEEKETLVAKGEHFFVKMRVKFLADSTNPVPGVIIRNRLGHQISASNTVWAGFKAGEIKKGEEKTFTFKFPNIYEVGYYTVTGNVVHNDMITIHDWRNDVVEFLCDKKWRTGGVVNPPYSVTME